MPPELVACTGGMHNGRVVVFHRGITLESADLIPGERPEAAGGVWIVPSPDDQRPMTWLDNGGLDGAERMTQAVKFTDEGELTAPLWSAPVETIALGALLNSAMTVHVSPTALRIWTGGLSDPCATIELGDRSPVVDATLTDPYVLLVHADGASSAYQAVAAKRTLVAVDISSCQLAARASLFADTRGSLPVLAPNKSVDGEAMEVDAGLDGEAVEVDGFYSSSIKGKGRRAPSTIGRALEGLDRIRVTHLIAVATTDGHLQVRPDQLLHR